MEFTEIQKEKIIEFLNKKMNKESKNFSKKCDEHEQIGDFEHWLFFEAENETADVNSWIAEIQLQLNILNCENQIKEIFKQYCLNKKAFIEIINGRE